MIRAARKKQGHTQLSLAVTLGYSSADFISKVESGRCHVPDHQVSKMAAAIGISVEEIVAAKLRIFEQDLRFNIRSGAR